MIKFVREVRRLKPEMGCMCALLWALYAWLMARTVAA